MRRLLLALAFLTTACGSDNSGPAPSRVEGTWQGNFPLEGGGTGCSPDDAAGSLRGTSPGTAASPDPEAH